MSRFFFETDPPAPAEPVFGGSSDVLVYFLSLAFSTRYGSLHPLSQMALILRGEFKIDMTPLTTFADRNIEDPSDERELQRAWQDSGPLAETLRAVNEALASGDERFAELMGDTPDVAARLVDLQQLAEEADGRGARVRMTFEL